MLVKCAYFHEFLGPIKFSSYFNQKYDWLLHKVRNLGGGGGGGGGHLPQMPHPGSAIGTTYKNDKIQNQRTKDTLQRQLQYSEIKSLH